MESSFVVVAECSVLHLHAFAVAAKNNTTLVVVPASFAAVDAATQNYEVDDDES